MADIFLKISCFIGYKNTSGTLSDEEFGIGLINEHWALNESVF